MNNQEKNAYPVKRPTVFIMVLAAFAVRFGFMMLLTTYQFNRVDDFSDGGETANIAASIANGHGFSSPFANQYTGPTAWIAPVYPYSISLVYRYLGRTELASPMLIFTAQAALSAFTVIPILGIAGYTVGRSAGLLAAWTWTLFPWFSKWSVTWVWEVSLSALLLASLAWYVLGLRGTSPYRHWIGLGALEGFALLVNPALATFLLVSVVWCRWGLHLRKREWFKPAAAMTVCLLVVSPWMIRNRAVFGQWVFLRGNFGYEFYQGNYHLSQGHGSGARHPMGNPKEYEDYKRLGEVGYIQSRQKTGLQFVREHPAEFIWVSLKRATYFWRGTSLLARIPWYWVPASFAVLSYLSLFAVVTMFRRKPYAWQVLLGVILLYPLPYYLTFNETRYRHAIEPIMLLLVAYTLERALAYLVETVDGRSARTPRSAAAGAVAGESPLPFHRT